MKPPTTTISPRARPAATSVRGSGSGACACHGACVAPAAVTTVRARQLGSDRRKVVPKDIYRLPWAVASVDSMTAALLLAEPEPAIRGYLERQLQSDGFHVLQAAFGGEALARAERTRPDLVLCSELELCARLREGEPGRTWNRNVPVIVLGPAGADAVDRVRAFQRGADDYVHRPVVYDELVARIRAVLRRTAPPFPQLMEVGPLAIDRLARVVTVRAEQVRLAGKEFELLCTLASDPHRVFTKD